MSLTWLPQTIKGHGCHRRHGRKKCRTLTLPCVTYASCKSKAGIRTLQQGTGPARCSSHMRGLGHGLESGECILRVYERRVFCGDALSVPSLCTRRRRKHAHMLEPAAQVENTKSNSECAMVLTASEVTGHDVVCALLHATAWCSQHSAAGNHSCKPVTLTRAGAVRARVLDGSLRPHGPGLHGRCLCPAFTLTRMTMRPNFAACVCRAPRSLRSQACRGCMGGRVRR